MTAPISRLVDSSANYPGHWGPPMAALLRQHGAGVLAGVTEDARDAAAVAPGSGRGGCYALALLHGVASHLTELLATVAAEAAGEVGPGAGALTAQAQTRWNDLLWLLRVARELALVWPAQLHPAGTAAAGYNGGGQSAGFRGPQQPQEQERQARAEDAGRLWQQVWDATVAFVSRCERPDGDKPPHHHAGAGGAALLQHVGDAATWLLQAQLAARLLSARSPLNRPAVAEQLQDKLWKAPVGDAASALLATLAAGGRLGGGGQKERHLREALLRACTDTICGSPGGGGATALSAPLPLGASPPVLAALHALLSAPPALMGAPLLELNCESAAAGPAVADCSSPCGVINAGVLAARLLAQQDAWEAGQAAPSLLQSAVQAAEVAAAFSGGSCIAAALTAAEGSSLGDCHAFAHATGAASGAAMHCIGAHCDWWALDAESALVERQLAALGPAEQRLGRRLEAAQAARLACQMAAAAASDGSGADEHQAAGIEGGKIGGELWWEAAGKLAQLMIEGLRGLISSLQAGAVRGSVFTMSEAAAAEDAAAKAAAQAQAARSHLLPLLQLATVAAALCAAAAVRVAPGVGGGKPSDPRLRRRRASNEEGGQMGQAEPGREAGDRIEVDSGAPRQQGEREPGQGQRTATPEAAERSDVDLEDLLGRQLGFCVAAALTRAGAAIQVSGGKLPGVCLSWEE